MKNKAFTLIEVLIVVLIIGILAAIAVPQYQKAVAKTKLQELILQLKGIYRDAILYHASHGELPLATYDFDSYDRTSGKKAWIGAREWTRNDSYINTRVVAAGYEFTCYAYINHTSWYGAKYCKTGEKGGKLLEEMGWKKFSGTSSAWTIPIPEKYYL